MTAVLVVDDSPVDRRLAGGILEKNPALEVRYATSGQDALAEMARQQPDIVVTDLQMPDLTGLELVERIRAKHPLVPVILMTAHGSEEIAVRALEVGAASYVPKARLATDLEDTVENVMAMARADRRHERLLECLTRSETEFVLDNDPDLIPPLVDLFQQHVARMQLCDETGRIRLGIALEEALLNALFHGNLELSTEELREASSALFHAQSRDLVAERRRAAPYSGRHLRVKASINPEAMQFTISDEGPGFDTASLGDPHDPANLQRETGRGLVLMRTFMDEVRYNPSGNEVTLVKRRERHNGRSPSNCPPS